MIGTTHCWSSKPGEMDQWIMIDLEEFYFVRELTIYNREVDTCAECAKRTHDFVINVLQTEKGDQYMTCAVYKGVMPLDAIENVSCKEDVWGRFIRISAADVKDPRDLMTFCEIKIYGDEVLRKPWTLEDCPLPPLLTDATVEVSYAPGRALATYTCKEDYTMCKGFNVMRCTSYEGWTGSRGSCLQTTRTLNYGRKSDLSKFPICNPKLGEGIELWVFPKDNTWELSLMIGEEGDTVLALKSAPKGPGVVVTISTVTSGTRGNEVSAKEKWFTLELEAHIQIAFLSESLLIFIDGKYRTTYPHHLATPQISFIESTANINIRKVKPFFHDLSGFRRIPLEENLALKKSITAVSNIPNFQPENLVDGDLTREGGGGQCWHPVRGEKYQWVKIDLAGYYFIRELIVYLRETCSGCEDRTHDFVIDVMPNDKVDWATTRCAFYQGVMPLKSVEKIRCADGAWGRYIRIRNTRAIDEGDLMTFCEVQVYGDKVDDVDECTEGTHNCPETTVCTNTPGSFKCTECPGDYSIVSGICIKFVTTKKNYADAAWDCETTSGGRVVHLDTNAKIEAVEAIIKKNHAGNNFYIGLRDQPEYAKGDFRWTDGTAVTDNNWAQGQPDNRDKDDCVIINSGKDYTWNDLWCTDTFPYICEVA